MFCKSVKVILKIQNLQGRQNVLKAPISPCDLAILLSEEMLYTEFSEMHWEQSRCSSPELVQYRGGFLLESLDPGA